MNLLEELWGDLDGLYGEIRQIKNREVEQTFLTRRDMPDLVHDMSIDSEIGWDCYFGVLPRTREEGTADATVSYTKVLWADVDAKRTGGKYAGLAGIRMAKQTPSIIVDSGRGWHCYWLLREHVPFDEAQLAMKALAREVQGDAVYDRARVLRVPGTHNHKQDPPLPVRIVYWDTERKYRISDFDTIEDKPISMQLEVGSIYPGGSPPLWLEELVRDGAPRGSRSEVAFKVVLWMTRYHWLDDEIEMAFKNSPNGIGEKYHELGTQGPRWLRRTIKAARSAA